MQVAMMGEEVGIGPVGKNNAGMKECSIFKGLAPNDPACALDLIGPVVGLQGETDGCVQGQRLPAGEADAVVAEVDGPGVVFPESGNLVMAGNFGKAE